MPGFLPRNRSLVRRGSALVVASEACRSRCCGSGFFIATPCSPCGTSAEAEAIYVATSAVCDDGSGNPPVYIYVLGRCYEVHRPTIYRLCPPGYIGVGPCIPPDAQIVSPGQPVECLNTQCEDPRCGSRYWEGQPCDPAYNGQRVFVECLTRCGFHRPDGFPTCFKFGDLPPLGFLPPGSLVLLQSHLNPLIGSCCTCSPGCVAQHLEQNVMTHPDCSPPQAYVDCCCGDMTQACHDWSIYVSLTTFGPDFPDLYPETITIQIGGRQCNVNGGTVPPFITGTETRVNPGGTEVFPITAGSAPSCPPMTTLISLAGVFYAWPWNTNNLPCPGDWDFTYSSSSTCTRAAMAVDERFLTPDFLGRTRINSFRAESVVTGMRNAGCSNSGCDNVGPIGSPVGPDEVARLARRGTRKLPSGLIVPDTTVRPAGGGCSGCGGGGGI
jgi:hypothetical protein